MCILVSLVCGGILEGVLCSSLLDFLVLDLNRYLNGDVGTVPVILYFSSSSIAACWFFVTKFASADYLNC